jgi:hypothetical protein
MRLGKLVRVAKSESLQGISGRSPWWATWLHLKIKYIDLLSEHPAQIQRMKRANLVDQGFELQSGTALSKMQYIYGRSNLIA